VSAVPERVESLAGVIEPVVASLGLELFDLELTGSGPRRILRVVVDRDGGVDLDSITRATEALTPVLDHEQSLSGPYALEVSSPGLERALRKPDHYRRAVGATVSVKSRDAAGAMQRRRGVLTAADDTGFILEADGSEVHVDYADVTQARTVFEWGPAPKPERGKAGRKAGKKKEAARR
jgi:ribosome maturation factor RimP